MLLPLVIAEEAQVLESDIELKPTLSFMNGFSPLEFFKDVFLQLYNNAINIYCI